MKNILFLFFAFFLFIRPSLGQQEQRNIIYIIDSIPVMQDPEPGNEIVENEIADVTVIKNKDTLKSLGYGQFDGAVFVFTKEYRNRPDQLKKIPSTLQMERKGDAWYFQGTPYTGEFIDYYYSGRKQGTGILKNGKLEGLRKMYFQNGKVSIERHYASGIPNGTGKEFYENGVLKQKGTFINGKEDGTWEIYFPNGKIKQRSVLKDGIMEGQTTIYYSTGKVLAVELAQNGKLIPDKNWEKLYKVLEKGHENNKKGDFKSAIKHYTKALEIDSTYAETYFSRGTAKLNNLEFDEAIIDFDKALIYEPFYMEALANRAFARIRKHQLGSSRKLHQSNGVTVLASKDSRGIPESEISLICSDLEQAVFLGDEGKMILEAVEQFCKTKQKP